MFEQIVKYFKNLLNFDPNLKIEFELWGESYESERMVLFRIEPSQLDWFRRLFLLIFKDDGWHKFYHAYPNSYKKNYYFSKNHYHKILKPMKTYGQAMDYLKDQDKLLEEFRQIAIERGTIWGDEKKD